MVTQPLVLAEQAAIEVRIESQNARCGGVQEPHLAGAMLYSDRTLRCDRVERAAVQHAGDGFVIADAANPLAAGGARKRNGKRVTIADLRRTAVDGSARGGEGEQVDVMIMQTGKQSPSPRLDDFFATARRKPGADLDNATVATAHIGAA